MYDHREHMHEFEDFLHENAEMHKLYPSDKVWSRIQQELHPKLKWTYLFVAMIVLSLGIVGTIYDSRFIADETMKLTLYSRSSEINKPNEDATILQDPIVVSTPKQHKQVYTPSSRTATITKTEAQRNLPSFVPKSNLTPALNPIVASAPTYEEKIPSEDEIAEGTLKIAAINRMNTKVHSASETYTPRSIIEELKKLPKSKTLKLGWQLYISPTTSYRKLSGSGLPYYTNAGNNMRYIFPANSVEKSVTHKPSLGFEMGGALTYAVGKNFRLKTGIQFNVNRYEVQAFHAVPEVTSMTRNAGADHITAVSTYRNYSGFSKTWLKNQHILMSLPLGAEWSLFGNDNIQFNIAGTIQPTLVVNNQAYMISANMTNYAKAPALYREFNVAAGAEAFLSIKGKSLRYNIGPQFRYQLFSSYKKPYPISEHLTDYGLKLSIGR